MDAQETTNWWYVFHQYRHLVKMEYALPFECPDDGGEMFLRPRWENDQIDDMPRLYCYRCGRTRVPGSEILNQVKEVVDRYYAQ